MPAFDRDSGSQDIDNTVRFLLDAGWSVTFLAREEEGTAEERHANRLRQLGVATYAGLGWLEPLARSGAFDLAVVAFWELAAAALPVLRRHSPGTRVLVNSMDLHLLRDARQAFGRKDVLERPFGEKAVRELNAYRAADGVIAVSDKEAALLRDFLGDDRVHHLPLADDVDRSTVPLDDRRGMYFVGNFRHLPNREAVQWLVGDVLPLVDPALLAEHPLTVLGNWLDKVDLDLPTAAAGVRLVGWVPHLAPYVVRSRISVVPLLHGAGVKRKVLQAMMAGTPVVTTPTGAEGLDLVQGEHALIAEDGAGFAAGITHLLTDDDVWRRLATAGADLVDGRHRVDVVRRRFDEIVAAVLARPARNATGTATGPEDTAAAVRRRIRSLAEPDAVVVVVSGGDEALVDLGPLRCWHFPQGREGGWAGYDPVDGSAAVSHLEALRARGARYFVLPRPAFSWRSRYPELHEHLESSARRLHQDEHLVAYDLQHEGGPAAAGAVPAGTRVAVLGTYADDRPGPPPELVEELAAARAVQVRQSWRRAADAGSRTLPGADEADYVVLLSDDAVVPQRFVDDLVATQVGLGVDRLQPAHVGGPDGGPPVTERLRGVVAREVDAVTPLPVLSLRAGASPDGPTVLSDDVTVGLRRPLGVHGDPTTAVGRVWVRGTDGRLVRHERPEPVAPPRISVLVATFERAELLRSCLTSLAKQTIDRADYEVVVVDDGSERSAVEDVAAEFAEELQVVAVRIEHAGRSAAKNLAVLLARAPLVLFFDDDDRAAPDLLERHLQAHERRPAEAVAVLGHTDWAPELELSPLMHYVTDIDRLLFAYERLEDGQELDWRGFWEGRVSCKRSLLLRHGLHDQRIVYSIDIELAWRLSPFGLRVVYDASARSVMARPLDLEAFCARTVAKGRSHAVIAALHEGSELAGRLGVEGADGHWSRARAGIDALRRRVDALERRSVTDDAVLPELHAAYRELFRSLHARGAAEPGTAGRAAPPEAPTTVEPFPTAPDFGYDGSPPEAADDPVLSISIPVWSRTPELADMARRTIERIWEVARVPTEVVVVDNGSPHEVPLPARVHRFPENKGVSVGWNAGIRLSRGPVLCVLNSDCRVEPGWDEALVEAATDGRRVAFPYTDHCDGRGFTRPDQGGTSGWCFVMHRDVQAEVGVFDEWFSPAFLEDTDYWHRAWQLGIELSPVPAARVVHARRTTASTDPRVEWLLQGHRYKYGWKHGVDPHRAPPYYNRDIVDYHGRVGPGGG
jgi:GT2 family glycosyltransferase/glycosyltransferase involved in cell wall biosynthesis